MADTQHGVFHQLATLPRAVILAMALFVGLLDLVTGPTIAFPILYVIPVIIAAWGANSRDALFIGFALPLVRAAIELAVWEVATPLVIIAVNATVRIAVLVTLGWIAANATRAQRRVFALEGLLPICSVCKRIRELDGHWLQVEAYIAQHSRAEFTHGRCPECLHRVYRATVD